MWTRNLGETIHVYIYDEVEKAPVIMTVPIILLSLCVYFISLFLCVVFIHRFVYRKLVTDYV